MTTQLAPNSMSLPPPSSLELDLLDGDRAVGWVSGHAFGFRGFANEHEAAHAAWVAHRTLARLARRHGARPVPIDVEPLSLRQDGDRTMILASGRPFATLVLPGIDSRSGTDSFGFEIEVPSPRGELTMRSIAYRIYRTLRKSGLRWAMWNRQRVIMPLPVPARSESVRVPARVPVQSSPSALAFVSKFILTGIAIVIGAAVIATAPSTVIVPIGTVLAAGLVASGLLALVGRWRAAHASRPARPPASSASRASDPRRDARLRDDLSDEAMRELGWVALGLVSITVLALALVVPGEIGAAFAAIGLAGLVVFRLTAAWAGWVPRGIARADFDVQSVARLLQRERTPNVDQSRSNGAPGGRRERAAVESRNGTLPRLASR